MRDNKIAEEIAIEEMVIKYSNDAELGKKIREYFVAKGIFKNPIVETEKK